MHQFITGMRKGVQITLNSIDNQPPIQLTKFTHRQLDNFKDESSNKYLRVTAGPDNTILVTQVDYSQPGETTSTQKAYKRTSSNMFEELPNSTKQNTEETGGFKFESNPEAWVKGLKKNSNEV